MHFFYSFVLEVFAELSYEKFNQMYDYFADVYQSSLTSSELTEQIQRLMYSNRFPWKNVGRGVGFPLLQQAVFNSIQQTANKRRSTFAEVSQAFSSRRSIIADIIQKPNERYKSHPVDELVQHISFFSLTGQTVADSGEELNKLDSITILMNACVDARKNFYVFVASENFMTAASLQKKASSIVGMFRSLGNLDSIATAAQMCYSYGPLVEIGLDYVAIEVRSLYISYLV